MKKSIVVSNKATIFSALDFKISLEENIEKIASLGFDGVELAIRNPQDLEIVLKIFRLFFIVSMCRYFRFHKKPIEFISQKLFII